MAFAVMLQNDFIHAFASFTASDAHLVRPSDCTYQTPLDLK